jgi:hypothetical protein
MSKKLSIDEIPELPGYMTLAAIAEKYSVSKSTVYYMIMGQRLFRTVVKVTKGSDEAGKGDKRPMLLIKTSEVEKVFAERSFRVVTAETSERLKEWNRRIKQWGRTSGWSETAIHVAGAPPRILVDAYLAEHPDDQRPEMSEVAG